MNSPKTVNPQTTTDCSGRQTPRRCFVTRTTDGCEYISEFDDSQTAAVKTTVKYPDGREQSW